MSVPTFFDRVLYNDGEGIDYSDFNTMQQMIRAQWSDSMLGMNARINESDWVPTNSSRLWVPQAAHALAKAGASNLQVTNTPGMISQWTTVSDPDGATPHMLSYWVAANDLQFTCNTADPTNPRIDLFAIKLIDGVASDSVSKDFQDATTHVVTSQSFNKRTSITLTTSYTAGTPGATPAFPSTPAGFAPFCYVYVPATYATTFVNTTHILDAKYPIGLRTIMIPAIDMNWNYSATTFTLSAFMEVTDTGSGNTLWCPLPLGNGQRLIAATAFTSGTWTANFTLKRFDYSTTLIPKNDVGSIPGNTAVSFSSGSLLNFLNATPPVWGCGRQAPYDAIYNTTGQGLGVQFVSGAVSDKMRGLRIYYLGT